MQDMLGNFLGRAHLCMHQHISLLIERLAVEEQLPNRLERIGRLQQWPVRLVPDPLPDNICRRPKADHKRMSLQAGQVFAVGYQSPASGNDAVLQVADFVNDLPLQRTKGRFAGLRKNLGDAASGPFLDQHVCIQKCKLNLLRYQPADRRFAAAHEAYQGNIAKGPVAIHVGLM